MKLESVDRLSFDYWKKKIVSPSLSGVLWQCVAIKSYARSHNYYVTQVLHFLWGRERT